MLIIFSMLYIISLLLIYPITRSLYLNRISYTLTALPLYYTSRGPCGEVSPGSLVPPVGKENLKGTTNIPPLLWIALWEPLLWSHSVRIADEQRYHKKEN